MARHPPDTSVESAANSSRPRCRNSDTRLSGTVNCGPPNARKSRVENDCEGVAAFIELKFCGVGIIEFEQNYAFGGRGFEDEFRSQH